MGKDCEFVFLDKDGNKSAAYYDVLKADGEEAAVSNYIDKTLAVASVKFSKFTSADELLKISKTFDKKGPHHSDYIGVTRVLKEYSAGLSEDIKIAMAINQKADDIIKDYLRSNNGGKINEGDARKKAKKFFEDEANKPILDLYVAEVQQKWDNQREQGSEIHKVIEYALEARNKALEADPGADVSFRQAAWFTKQALKTYNEGFTSKEEVPITESIQGNLNIVVEKLLKRIEALEKEKGTTFKVMPELWLAGKTSEFNGKKVYGKSDIVLYSEKEGVAIVIDLKTKSERSVHNFDAVMGNNMLGPLSDLPDNPKSHTDIQTAIYAAILENDHGVDYVETETFLIPATLSTRDGEVGNREWKFTTVDVDNVKTVEGRKLTGAITALISYSTGEGDRKDRIGIDSSLNKLYNDNLASIQDETEAFVDNQMTTARKTKDGQFFWYDTMNRSKVIASTEKELRSTITRVYKEFSKMKKSASSDFINYFKTGKTKKTSIWNKESYKEKANKLLEGISPKTHDILTSTDLKELDGVGTDVLVIQDKKTKEITLLSISPTYNASHDYHEEGSEDVMTTLLGPVMTDAAVKAKYGNGMIPDSNTHNLSLMRLALVAAELKKKSPGKFGKVRALKSVTLLGKYNTFKTSLIDEQLAVIKAIRDELEESGKDIPPAMEAMTQSRNLSNKESYEQDHFMMLVDLIRESKDPLFGTGHHEISEVRTNLKKRISELERDGTDLTSDYILEKRLAEYAKSAYKLAASNRNLPLTASDEIAKDPTYLKAMNAYLALRDALIINKPKFKGAFLSAVNSAKTANDPLADAFDKIVSEHEQRVRDQVSPFFAEHNRLVDDLMKKSEGVSFFSKLVNVDIYKRVFEPMLEDGYDFDPENTENWMKFKDPDDVSLSKEQSDYIKFFNKYVKTASRKLLGSQAFRHMYPDSAEGIPANDTWKEGYIPIIPSSATADLQETMTLETRVDPGKMIGKALKRTFKKSDKVRDNDDVPWDFTSGFMDQVDINPGRGSSATRKLLGITEAGKALDQPRNIEKNPILLLNLYMLNASRKEHMEQAAFATHALDTSLSVVKTMYPEGDVDVKPLQELIRNLTKIRVHGRYNEEKSRVGNLLDAVNRISSIGLFWGSLRQFSTEAATATTQTTSSMLGTAFNNILFQGDNKYNVKDYGWAATKMAGPFGNQILADYGLYNSDLGQFTSSDYIGTRAGSLWQTKWGFAPIHNVLRQATQTVVLAQMHKEGVTDKTYSLDKKTGRFKYDELKDARFYVYDPSITELKGQKQEPPKSKEDKQKHQLWLAHRKKMAREGSIKNGKMTRPFTTQHLQSMKSYAIRLFGAMDSSQALAVEIHATGRSLMKFKKWMRQKINNLYAETYVSTQEGNWVIVDEETGEYDFVGEEFEGYWQSITGILNDIRRTGAKDALAKASNRRKENLSKLLADLVLFALLYYAVTLLMESEFYESVMGKEIVKGMGNAVGDIMPLKGIYDIAESSPFAATSVVTNTVVNMMKTAGFALTGDWENAGSAAQKSLETFGAYRFGEGLLEFAKQ